jgi:hypothetical protein
MAGFIWLLRALAIHFMHYNFCRIHQTLRVTPAMEAGIARHVWSCDELAALPAPKTKDYRLTVVA